MFLLPAAPSAALATSERPSLPLVGSAAVAAHRPPPLWLWGWRMVLRPAPRPRWVGGSWPDSHSGGGGGTGLGGEVGGWPIATFFFFAGAGDGTTDSSLALLFTGSPSSPPLVRSAISFLAATLLALEVRCTPSPVQMLVPLTVVRS
jgi:hypothetical protein